MLLGNVVTTLRDRMMCFSLYVIVHRMERSSPIDDVSSMIVSLQNANAKFSKLSVLRTSLTTSERRVSSLLPSGHSLLAE